jgi:hypothetical protein
MKEKRRVYTAEFWQEALRLLESSGKRVAEIVTPSMNRPTHRAIPRTLGMALARLPPTWCLSKQRRIVAPIGPEQPDQQQFITHVEGNSQ